MLPPPPPKGGWGDEDMASQRPGADLASVGCMWTHVGAMGGRKGKILDLGAPVFLSRRVATGGGHPGSVD